eukprot:TRINITY_DN3053_c1_g1_i6.p1 TRINITY_DN3053_c1_g1~~TRINITY_DN3053_c1_g1_i6.p1  ORF type:complete len:583 (-),score=38.52 TRINITY_DN3053_c1_g1_i6:50-1798(-)
MYCFKVVRQGQLSFCFLVIWLWRCHYCQRIADGTCDLWKSSPNANFSYVVSITVNDDGHFCTGVLVAPDWVLTSYSCFKRIIDHIKDLLSLDEIGPSFIVTLDGNPTCFDINQQEAQIKVSTATDNCVWYGQNQSTQHSTLVQFGVIEQSQAYVDLELPQGVSQGSRKGNFTVATNDFLLLKLDGSFLDPPLESVRILPFDRDKQNTSYDILSWSKKTYLSYLQFGYKSIQPEFASDYSCGERFAEAVCNDDNNGCINDNFICTQFELPNIARSKYLLHSGDPLVRHWQSVEAEIYGMFSEIFMPESSYSFRSTGQQVISSGNFSLEKNGAIFTGFESNDQKWIEDTVNRYSGNRCIIPAVDEEKNDTSTGLEGYEIAIIIVVIVVVVVLILFLAIFIALKGKLRVCTNRRIDRRRQENSSEDQQSDQGGSGRLDGSSINRVDSFNRNQIPVQQQQQQNGYLINDEDVKFLVDLHLPQQVQPFPHSAFKSYEQKGEGTFGMVYKAQFTEAWATKIGLKEAALKTVKKNQLIDILAEVKTMSGLNDHHIVRLLGYSLEIKQLGAAMVMEFVPLLILSLAECIV